MKKIWSKKESVLEELNPDINYKKPVKARKIKEKGF